MTRSATSPELSLYRSDGKKSLLRAVILKPPIVYRARINQTFSTFDQVLSIVYDGGTGTLSDVLPDMEVWIGSTLDAHDKGICRLRDKDGTHFYLSETSEIQFADNDYVTILAGFGVWARPVRISGGTVYMDETLYSDQHENWDPQPNMGADQVVELTGVTVETTFHAGSSFCPGSSIASYAWSCPTASATSDPTLADFTVQFDTGGTHLVYLTVTADNGKTFFGARNAFVIDDDHPAFSAAISNPGRCDVDSGGWEFELTLFGDVDLADVYERAKIILISDDYYGGTKQAIGPVVGSENIWFIGWISKENNHLSAEQGSVTFTANGAAYWMGKIPSWPDGVELSTSADWTSVPDLTVDLGVYHFLRWRSTVTRVMDVTLTGDTRASPEVSSSAQDLWAQLQEMTWNQIYARPGVNALNQLSIQIHPSLIPTADRAYPTVMAITKADYGDGLDFERSIVDEVGIVDMSGVAVTGPGTGLAYFALAPGHSLPHYGVWDIQQNLLVASQEQVITLAGLYRSWRNSHFKNIPIVFDAAIRLIDCFPNQRCTINIASDDNIRGWSYNGGLIPTSVQLIQDPKTGYCHTEVTFEAQTSESEARVGDTPGSDGNGTQPSMPSFPPLPDFPVLTPIDVTPQTGTSTFMFWDNALGFIFSTNFDAEGPHWQFMNSGLSPSIYTVQRFFVCPNGSVYAFGQYTESGFGTATFIARAPSVGAAWTILYDYPIIHALYPETSNVGVGMPGYNRNLPESVGFYMGNYSNGNTNIANFWLGANGAFAKLAAIPNLLNAGGRSGYGGGRWRIVGNQTEGFAYPAHFWDLGSSGGSIVTQGDLGSVSTDNILDAGDTGVVFLGSGDGLYRFENNFTVSNYLSADVNGGTGMACDPTGAVLLGEWDTAGKGVSSDGGYTWGALAGLPPGIDRFVYAGGAQQWVAFGGANIFYTDDLVNWHNKLGDMLSINPGVGLLRGFAVVPYGG